MIRALIILLMLAPLSALEVLGVDYRQTDKQGHFTLGACASAIAMLILDRIEPDAKWYARALVGTASAAAVGVGKEWYDSRHLDRHAVEADDVIATTTGGAVVALTLCWKF
jgi:hypothetical protein